MAWTWDQLDSDQQANALLAAQVALGRFGNLGRQAVVNMVAIAGAESSMRANASGDHYSQLSGSNRNLCLQMNCNGYCSHGLWQIFAPVHRAMLVGMGAPDPLVVPCGTANWLYDVFNCARAARGVYDAQGYGAWTAYKTGAYLGWMDVAEQAVAMAEYQPSPPEGDNSWWGGIIAATTALVIYLALKGR